MVRLCQPLPHGVAVAYKFVSKYKSIAQLFDRTKCCMPKIPPVLTGAAGEHFIAYKLSCLGLVAALPRGGSMGVDVLVSSVDGSKTLAIQVKTTDWAMRTRGRGDKKEPYELQFPLGYKSAKLDNPNLVFAFVDLRGTFNAELQPDVYLVPATFVCTFCRDWVDQVKMVRLHIGIEKLSEFKNNWSGIESMLT